MSWSDDLQVFSRRHKIKCKQINKTPMHPTTITNFVKPDIVSLLFVDAASSLKLATLENKYVAAEVPTVISPAMVNAKKFDLFSLLSTFIIWIIFNINVRNDIWRFNLWMLFKLKKKESVMCKTSKRWYITQFSLSCFFIVLLSYLLLKIERTLSRYLILTSSYVVTCFILAITNILTISTKWWIRTHFAKSKVFIITSITICIKYITNVVFSFTSTSCLTQQKINELCYSLFFFFPTCKWYH